MWTIIATCLILVFYLGILLSDIYPRGNLVIRTSKRDVYRSRHRRVIRREQMFSSARVIASERKISDVKKNKFKVSFQRQTRHRDLFFHVFVPTCGMMNICLEVSGGARSKSFTAKGKNDVAQSPERIQRRIFAVRASARACNARCPRETNNEIVFAPPSSASRYALRSLLFASIRVRYAYVDLSITRLRHR